MKAIRKRKGSPELTFEQEYRAALSGFIARPGEPTLRRAYDLGRSALEQGKSLLEITALYQETILEFAAKSKDSADRLALLRAGGDFLRESLSAFEMAHRGFRDAVQALRHLNETLENEISRIAFAVHDEAGQMLVAVHLALAQLAQELPPSKQDHIARMEEMLRDIEKQLRRYSHELRPTILDDLGWIPAIHFLAEGITKRSQLPIKIEAKSNGRLPRQVETTLYRVVQEALTNVTKHAKASAVVIQVHKEGQMMNCSIRDDGVGFDLSSLQSNRTRKGLGLISIRERLNAIGGTLSVESAPRNGTRLLIRVPVGDA